MQNLERLAHFSSHMAELLPTIDCKHVALCRTDKDELNLKRTQDSEITYYHDNHDPQREADHWFANLDLGGVDLLYVYGVGLGYYYQAAQDWLRADEDHHIIFLEDDPEVLRLLLETEIGKQILYDKQARLYGLTGTEKDHHIFESLAIHFVFNQYLVTALELYAKNHREKLSSLESTLGYFNISSSCTASELQSYSKTFFKNFYRNMLKLPQSYLADSLFGKFTDIPAIICAAGPSLDKNIDVLAKLSDRALILAGGTSVNILNSRNILPHFGIGVDPNWFQQTRLIANKSYEVPFFYRNRMHFEAFNTIHGPRLYLTGAGGYKTSEWFEKKLGINGEFVDEGYNVINLGLSIAHKLGCNPIILVGVDLAYSEGRSYASGLLSHPLHDFKRDFQTKRKDEELLLRTDIYGKPIYTLWKWMMESAWYGKFAASHAHVSIVNATEGGIGFPGIPNLNLSDIAEYLLPQKYDFRSLIHGEIQNSPLPKTVTLENVKKLMTELTESLERIIPLCEVLEKGFGAVAETIERKREIPSEIISPQMFEALEKINQEEGYQHLLTIFNDYFVRYLTEKMRNIEYRENISSEIDDEEHKAILNESRYRLLKETAVAHIKMINLALRKHEDSLATISQEPQKKPVQQGNERQDSAQLKKVVQNYPNGNVKTEKYFSDVGVQQGFSTFYSEDGNILARSWFSNGLQEGESWFYYNNKALNSLQRFKQGKWHGEQKFYYPTGEIKSILNYHDGILHGQILLYHPSGRNKRELHFVEGKREGKELMWNDAGTLVLEVEYLHDKPLGTARSWYSNGNLAREIIYDENSHKVSEKQWRTNGKLISQITEQPDDFFDQVTKQTDHLTDSLEQVFTQLNELIPNFAESESQQKNINNLTDDLQNLEKEMEHLRNINQELLKESRMSAEDLTEPIWKSPSSQREINRQLKEMSQQLTEQIGQIHESLSETLEKWLKEQDDK